MDNLKSIHVKFEAFSITALILWSPVWTFFFQFLGYGVGCVLDLRQKKSKMAAKIQSSQSATHIPLVTSSLPTNEFLQSLSKNKTIRTFLDRFSEPQRDIAIKFILIYGIQCLSISQPNVDVSLEGIQALISMRQYS